MILMAYEEYILRSKREEVKADSRLHQFLKKIDAEIVAQGTRSILLRTECDLVELWPNTLDKDWTVSAEHTYKVPDTRKRIGQKSVKTKTAKKKPEVKKTSTTTKKSVKK